MAEGAARRLQLWTWTGRGRAPRWLADARNRDRFLIRKA
ncbi:H-NS family nucleoid-associated regulatory protein [Paraburkholderia sp.]